MFPHIDLCLILYCHHVTHDVEHGRHFIGPNFQKNLFLGSFSPPVLYCLECTLFAIVLNISLIIQVLNFIAC